MKYILIGIAVLVLIPFVILGCNLAFAPASWTDVHMGDTSDDVKARYPAVDNSLRFSKGFDFLIERRMTGRWISFYFYGPDNRVAAKLLQYRIGTSRHFIIGSEVREGRLAP